MNIIRWEGFDEVAKFLGDNFALPQMLSFDMATDIYEKDGELIVEMELPGAEKENLDVSVKDGHLIVSGSREEKSEIKDKKFFAREIKRGSFRRVVTLPYEIDKNSVKATYKNGVLTVRMKKLPEDEGKVKVEVE